MKVYISNYRNHWISPYTILEKVCFWEKDKDVIYNLTDDPNNKYQKWVDRLTPLCNTWMKFLDFVHPRIEYVKIDRYDTWNMGNTLASIILPMLKQLKKDKQGAPLVADEDVPEHLRSTAAKPKENDWATDSNTFRRWDWVLDEMIFAFECELDDSWEDQYYSGEFDYESVPCDWDEKGKPTMYKSQHGPNYTYKCDYEGMQKVYDRIQNGFRLFGVYYHGLWD